MSPLMANLNQTGTQRRHMLAGLAALLAIGRVPTALAQDNTLFRLVYADTFAPFSYVDNSRLRGTLPALLQELLSRRLKLLVDHSAYPWARAQALVKTAAADAFVTVPTPERLQYAIPTFEPVVQLRLALFARADTPRLSELQKLRNISDLTQQSLGSYIGHGWVQNKLGHLPLQYATDRNTALRMLMANRFDAMADVATSGLKGIKALGLEGRVVELPMVIDVSDVHLCIGKTSPLLRYSSAIDEAMRSMKTDGTIARLLALN
ncbi:MAG: transporter substrate-binding domain-containing protein [Rhodoferax sp.]|nr:transporter substrate-binding domain-containing protein [Rhodoferax sp.]